MLPFDLLLKSLWGKREPVVLEVSKREEALGWWRDFNDEEQYEIIRHWKSFATDSRKEWSDILIQHSSSCIEKMYVDLVNQYSNKAV